MKQEILDIIIGSESAVLATTGPHGLNVVPLSVWEVKEGKIHLYDFFMSKTAENIQTEPKAVFTCWTGFVGVQVKGQAQYEKMGDVFSEAQVKMKERFPDRTLNGVIQLTPEEIFDIAPGALGKKFEF